MINRSWFNSELNNTDYDSNCDLKITEILNRFYEISVYLTKRDFNNLDELSNYLLKNETIVTHFNKWFFDIGKNTLLKLSKTIVDEDFDYVEDLNYYLFCLDCIFLEFETNIDYLEDDFSTLIDILFSLEETLLK